MQTDIFFHNSVINYPVIIPKTPTMLKYTAILLFLFFFTSTSYATKTINLIDGIKSGWISVNIEGKGGHTDKTLLLKIKNLKKRKVEVYISFPIQN